MSCGMGDGTVPGFSLTPDEEKFFVRFLRRRALPISAAVSALAGGLTAIVLSCSLAPTAAPLRDDAFDAPEDHALAAPLADEQARAERASLRKQIEALSERPAPAARADGSPGAADELVAELRRAHDTLRRELQTLATAVTELQRRSQTGAVPAAADSTAPAELEPVRKRLFNVEARQDREEASRLEWAGNVEQRMRNLELGRRTRESEEQAAMQAILDRLHAVEEAQTAR
jgi:hypothetical protein